MSSSLYATMSDTPETSFAREVTDMQSEVNLKGKKQENTHSSLEQFRPGLFVSCSGHFEVFYVGNSEQSLEGKH